jgi:hypothetical protein
LGQQRCTHCVGNEGQYFAGCNQDGAGTFSQHLHSGANGQAHRSGAWALSLTEYCATEPTADSKISDMSALCTKPLTTSDAPLTSGTGPADTAAPPCAEPATLTNGDATTDSVPIDSWPDNFPSNDDAAASGVATIAPNTSATL